MPLPIGASKLRKAAKGSRYLADVHSIESSLDRHYMVCSRAMVDGNFYLGSITQNAESIFQGDSFREGLRTSPRNG